MRGRETNRRFPAYRRIGVGSAIYNERTNSGHARPHGTVPFDCKARGKEALDSCVHFELREAQLLGKGGV
jgi:hypothetical protein